MHGRPGIRQRRRRQRGGQGRRGCGCPGECHGTSQKSGRARPGGADAQAPSQSSIPIPIATPKAWRRTARPQGRIRAAPEGTGTAAQPCPGWAAAKRAWRRTARPQGWTRGRCGPRGARQGRRTATCRPQLRDGDRVPPRTPAARGAEGKSCTAQRGAAAALHKSGAYGPHAWTRRATGSRAPGGQAAQSPKRRASSIAQCPRLQSPSLTIPTLAAFGADAQAR